MNEIDYAIIAILIISIGIGVVRGAVREVLNVVGWVLAFILSHAFAPNLAAYFSDWAAEPVVRLVVAWVAIFMLVLVVVGMIASLLTELMRKLGLGGLDRGVGGAVGLLRGALLLVALTLAAGLTKLPQTNVWREAAMTPMLEIAALYSRAVLPDIVASRIKYRASNSAPTLPAAPTIPATAATPSSS